VFASRPKSHERVVGTVVPHQRGNANATAMFQSPNRNNAMLRDKAGECKVS
jgi:hypothetical protein